MFTYQIRERIFRVDSNLVFPNQVELNFYFDKNTAFGNQGAQGRTWKQATAGSVLFNSNNGHFAIDPKNCIEGLEVVITHNNMQFSLEANKLTVKTYCKSNAELTELLDSLYYV